MQIDKNRWKSLSRRVKEIILSPYRFFKFLCFTIGLSVVILLMALGAGTYKFYSKLPPIETMSYKQLKKIGINRTVKKFEKRKYLKKYRWVSLEDMSRPYLYAIIVSEDGKFFEHSGINYNSVMSSIVKNIKKSKVVGGASTITQQVVKNLFLTNERSYLRKIKEIVIANQIEKRFTKNQILEIYLNIAEFGPNIYGAGMVARRYFKKRVKKLTALEGAISALFLPSPRRYHLSIYANKYLSPMKKKKIRRILKEMKYLEYISPKQYRKYQKMNYLSLLR